MSEWFGKLGQEVQDQIYRDFRIGMIEGKDIPSMAGDILANNYQAFSSGGILKAIRDSKAVARTAANLVSNRAREMTYQQNSAVIKGIEYVATLDDRTTLICMNLHGQVFPIDEGPRPPQHYNCRSTTVPVVKSWEEMGIPAREISREARASMDGQVADVKSFDEWLKAKDKTSPAVTDKLLGPVRAKLWREGQIRELSGFVDATGRKLDLEELGFSLSGQRLVK
jgi:SPP1 gp7 family putative phage head morphogenesis protein